MFIHGKAEVDPKARLGRDTSVWAFAAIRADEGSISIGDRTNVQEGCVIHGKDVSIGKNVTMGHGAVVHGAKVDDNVVVGIRSTVLDGAEVGEWCIIGAGSLVLPGKKIPPGSVVMGVPGKVVREVTEKDRDCIRESASEYVRRAHA